MTVKWMKKGKEAQAEIEKADALQAERSKGFVQRFWLPEEGEAPITFLDGDIDENGVLELNTYWEHQVYLNKSWRNWFVCTAEIEPCPICEGDDNPSLCASFTVIDHSEYLDRKGQPHKDEVRLFVAKRKTINILRTLAKTLGGLAGQKFQVSRTGEDAPNVGSVFLPIEGKAKVAAVLKKYGIEKPGVLDYEKVIPYRPAAELRKMGFGTQAVGTEQAVSEPAAKQAEDDAPFDVDDDL